MQLTDLVVMDEPRSASLLHREVRQNCRMRHSLQLKQQLDVGAVQETCSQSTSEWLLALSPLTPGPQRSADAQHYSLAAGKRWIIFGRTWTCCLYCLRLHGCCYIFAHLIMLVFPDELFCCERVPTTDGGGGVSWRALPPETLCGSASVGAASVPGAALLWFSCLEHLNIHVHRV